MLTTLKPGFYLGIDGGGTKTEAVIANENGHVLGRGKAGGANLHNLPIDIVYEHIRSAVHTAFNQAKLISPLVRLDQLDGICLGMAGIDSKYDSEKIKDYLQRIPPQIKSFNGKQVIICNDGFVGLKAATDDNWGICLISSTGCNCYGVNQSGKEASAGDWGYLLGDQGSGFSLGIKIIHRVIKEYDGRRPKSNLTPLVLKHLGLKEVPDLIPWAYSGSPPIKEIASLSQLLNEPELENSLELSQYLMYVSNAIIDSYRAVVHRLYMQHETFTVALVGGLFNLKVPFKERIKQEIMELTPNAHIMATTRTPAEGAVRIAQMTKIQKVFPESSFTVIY